MSNAAVDPGGVERVHACPVCGGTSFRARPAPLRWTAGEWFNLWRGAFGLARCRACGLVFVNPRPDAALLNRFYSQPAYAFHDHCREGGAQWASARYIQSVLARHAGFELGKRLLDYGCGGGFFVKAANEFGWRASGYDIAERAIESCRAQGIEATSRLAELSRGAFDVVTLMHVLEHAPEPAAVLDSIRELLAPAGKLLIEVPNAASLRARLSPPFLVRHARFDERYRAFPVHLFYFTRRTLAALLRRHGFAVQATLTAGLGLENLVLRDDPAPVAGSGAPPSPSPAASNAPRRSILKSALKRLILGSGLGENLVVIARVASKARSGRDN